MTTKEDRKRAEEIVADALTLADIEALDGQSLRKLTDAICAYAEEVRAGQRERDARIAATVKAKTRVADDRHKDFNEGYRDAAGFIETAIRNEVDNQ